MRGIFKILVFSFIIFTSLSISTDIEGKQRTGKDKFEKKQKYQTIGPIEGKMHNKKFLRRSLSRGYNKNSYSRTNNSHSLTEVGVGYGIIEDVFIDGNTVYLAAARYLIIMDISDKTNPTKIGELLLPGESIHIFFSGGYAYVTTSNEGLRIIDVSIPGSPKEISFYKTTDEISGIFVSGSYAYIGANSAGLKIIDISNPASPSEVGAYDTPGETGFVYATGGYAYVADGSTFRIIDVSNPTSPQEVGNTSAQGTIYEFIISGSYAYISEGYNGIEIIDISNKSSPQVVGSYNTPSFAEAIFITGNLLYLTNYLSGLRILNISTPTSPTEVGYFEQEGFTPMGLTVSGNYAYAVGPLGLNILNTSNPGSPQSLGSFSTPGCPREVYVTGNYAYLTSWYGGLRIFDISNPSSPQEIAHYCDSGYYPFGFVISGNYAYVTFGNDGLKVIDVSNLNNINEVGACDTPGSARDVYISGNYAYVADWDDGLRVIDVSAPNSPKEVGFCDTPGEANGIFVSGSHAYVADRNEGLRVIDISNPNSPSEVAFYNTPGSVRRVYVYGGYIYLAEREEGVRVIDLPNEIGHYTTQGGATDIFLTGNYAYVACWSGGLRILDISTPSNLKEVAYFEQSLQYATSVHVSGDYIFVANFYSGWSILKHDTTPPAISLNRNQLNFGYETGGDSPASQTFNISNSGGGTLNWSVTTDQNYISCSPTSGIDSGTVSVSVDPTGLSAGTHTGTITVSDPNASNSPQTVSVTLNIYNSNQTAAPFGRYTTPTDGSTVSSSIPVTGWVLDDIGVESLKIYRGSGNNLVYIGDAAFVEGARPDVEQAYPGYPMNYKAGWGYMMLTNFLPPDGNGTFKIHAIATDVEGHQVTLGTKTITVDNANAVKPFGAIDTPTQGGTASGDSFVNWGWVLTPKPNSIPTNGSTINVFVDSVFLGHPTYNIYRSDIATLFPGYANSDGAIGYFSLDTTAYENGVHTIHWTAQDNAGNTDGIGSRYFTIQNSIGNSQSLAVVDFRMDLGKKQNLTKYPVDTVSPVKVLKGYKKDRAIQKISPDDKGMITIHIRELEPLEIKLTNLYEGYMIVNNLIKRLPLGSTLDSEKDSFSWIPLPGFVGNYQFVFFQKGKNGKMTRSNVIVKILPKFFSDLED